MCIRDRTDRLKQVKTFIDKTESDQLFDRKKFVGHITGSAIIFDYKNSKVLLIKHIILQRWLQPGGHIEKTDASILDGVYREIFEETNIAKDDLMLISPILGKKFTIDIDSNPIPENPAKHEKQHFHHDLRYFFIYKGEKITDCLLYTSKIAELCRTKDIDLFPGSTSFFSKEKINPGRINTL